MEDTKLTEEQEKTIFEDLSKLDESSTNKLNEAKKETENTEYNGLEEIDISTAHYKDAFSPYNLSDEEAEIFINIINDFRANGNTNGVYEKLPRNIQTLISGICANTGAKKSTVTKTILESFITDAQRAAAVDEYNNAMNNLVMESNEEFANIYNKGIEEVFSKIDEIKETDPDKAARIEGVKKAFDDAQNLDLFLEWFNKENPKKYKKKIKRFEDEIFYFNSKIKDSGINISTIDQIPGVLSMFIDDANIDNIVALVIAILYHIISMDTSNLSTSSYGYKLLDNLYTYRFKMGLTKEEDHMIDQINIALKRFE